MPKDNQEEYQSWHEDLQVLMEEYWEVWESTTDVRLRREQFDKLKAFVTTYGNARELAGVEKVKSYVKDQPELHTMSNGQVFRNVIDRQATLDHIAMIKSELK
jgi:hypothetical protein